MSEITPANLLSAGYREWRLGSISGEHRFFQKCFPRENGTRFFIDFREWKHPDNRLVFDTVVYFETDSHGYAWVTLREGTIEAAEKRAEAFWRAGGAVPYE